MVSTAKNSSGALKLPPTHRELFLALLIGELTLRARGTYAAGAQSAEGARLRVFNELVNRVAAQFAAILSGAPAYPDHTFVQILREVADEGGCGDDLRIAFRQARTAASAVRRA